MRSSVLQVCRAAAAASARSGGLRRGARLPWGLAGALRPLSSRSQGPEFEHPFDDAAARHLKRPGHGGYNRGSFVRPHNGEDVQEFYDFGGKLGEGGFGAVCAATDRRTGESVAIKKIPKDTVPDMQALEMEVELLKAADHPNVVRLYETYEDVDNLYLVMECCSGGELWKRILSLHECGLGFSEKELANCMLQMLRAVSYCHKHNIVHRDLKPQNFLFSSSEEGAPLRLVDFGAGGIIGSSLGADERYLTKSVGTDGYMAPEVLRSLPYGPAVDLFSLGAVMHATITGVPPRWDDPAQAYKFPGKIRWRMLSAEAQDLLQKLLSADQNDRPTAADAMQHPWFQKMELAEESGPSLLTADHVERMRQFGRRSKLQRALMGSMVVFARLRSEESEALQRLFINLDKDGDGEVDVTELAEALRTCSIMGSDEATAEALVQAVDDSRHGKITCSEWLAAVCSQAWFSNQKGARRAFDALDADGDGEIGALDLMQALPGVFQPEELDEEIKRLDSDGDGQLSFDEFCALMKQDATASAAQG